MQKLKRRYVYETVFEKIMEYGIKNKLRAPNRKDNFPFFMHEYIKYLEKR